MTGQVLCFVYVYYTRRRRSLGRCPKSVDMGKVPRDPSVFTFILRPNNLNELPQVIEFVSE